MDDRIARLEVAIEQLRSAVRSLQQRIEVLEAHRGGVSSPGADVDATGATEVQSKGVAAAATRRDPYYPIVILTLIGRLFLVLAGGFFLRAMTEAGVLAVPVGIASAFTYGLLWLILADRAGRRQQITSSVFHALAAALVAFPLLVEATTRFRVLDAGVSALVLTALTAGFLAVASRQRLQAIAWITALAAVPTSVILLIKTAAIGEFGLYLIALGVATLWAAYLLQWHWPRWLVALAADLVVVGVTVRASSPIHQDVIPVALLLQLSLLGSYLASVAIRTLAQGRDLSVFDVVQTAVALALGFGGAVYLARPGGALPAVLGLAGLVLGTASYAAVPVLVDRQEASARKVYYYTTLGLVLVLGGLALDLRPPWLGPILAVLAVATTGLWARRGRLYWLLHGASYLVAAGLVSDAFGYAGLALATSPSGPWLLPDAAMLSVLAAGALAAWFAASRPAPQGGFVASGFRFVIVLVLVWLASGCVAGYLAPLVAAQPDRSVDAGALATVRTGVLAVATLVTAWIARRGRCHEWAWLVYPLLVGIGLKMVVQDFKDSRPATLFIALALYGAALILAPRLKRVAKALRGSAADS